MLSEITRISDEKICKIFEMSICRKPRRTLIFDHANFILRDLKRYIV